ncbi:MAG: helix-turn-helix domain-containing protein [Bacteroidota bacterium]
MNPKIEQARHLYLNCGKTQREIATEIGVSERTLYTWIRQYAWEQLKLAAYQAPALIAENLCSQLVELQNTIAAREPGHRYPTKDEAEITRKLLAGLDKIKRYPSKSQTLQVLALFRDHLRKSYGKDAARAFGMQMMSFLDNDPVNGYQPYEMEFGAEKITPVIPLYEEDPEDETEPEEEAELPVQNSEPQPEIAGEKVAESIGSKGISTPPVFGGSQQKSEANRKPGAIPFDPQSMLSGHERKHTG